jgi:hypothetical protein
MNNFSESATGFRLLLAHPVPWTYKSNYAPGKSAIIDKDGKPVVVEGQVSSVLYDAIWAMYFDLLRDEED